MTNLTSDAWQAQLVDKAKQEAQQACKLADMTAKHEELQTSTEAQAVSLQTLEQDISAKSADAQQLQTQLEGSHSELQSTQHELQQSIDAHSMLESQFEAQTAELESVSEQVCALKADKQQLHRQMETAAFDRQQLQSNLESHQAEAAEQLSKAKDQAQQLQVRDTVSPTYLGSCH